ncbi:lysylphosphatidylglycerol synthase domain-containing protein [Terrimonas rubra]|uniref:Lysylphosphatidylglycerol synthase domain-containing protein n=1 Tax=Terrimonas rubra TaxID=1035890 RepID=A0ABW6A1L2_9BACT
MQITGQYKRYINLFIRYFLGPLLFCWLIWFIYTQISRQPDIELAWQQILDSFNSKKIWLVIGAVALMLLNWGIEAVKWRISVKPVQEVSFQTAFKAILSGVSVSISTPYRVGEYLGRILYMNEGNKLKAVSLTVVGSISQVMVTLLMGLVGLLFMADVLAQQHILSPLWIKMIASGVCMVLVILTLFYFRLSWLVKRIDQIPAIKKFTWLINALENFNATILFSLLSLSVIRFLVFILQYYLLFRFFGVTIGFHEAWISVSLMFLVMAVVPTIALFTDLGLKGEISLKLIGIFSANGLGITLTTISIWLINLVIPALAGSLLILSVKKVFNNRNEKN